MAAAFIAVYFFNVNVILIILAAALWGVLTELGKWKKDKEAAA
jgi:hypothetical protein